MSSYLKPLSAVFLLLFLLYNPLFSQDYEKANKLYEQGKYDAAVEEYLKVIPWLEKENGKNDTTALPLYHYILGNAYYNLGNSEKAIEQFETAHAICQKNCKGFLEWDLKSLESLASIQQQLGDQKKSLFYYEEIMKNYERLKLKGEDLLQLAYAYNNVGMMYFNLSNDKEAVVYYAKAYKTTEKAIGTTNFDAATIQLNAALSYAYMENYAEARKNYLPAFKTIYQLDPANYATNLISFRSQAKGMVQLEGYAQAEHTLYIDIEARKKNLGDRDTSLLESYTDLGTVFYYQGDTSKARICYDSALVIINDKFKNDPDNLGFWQNYLAGMYDLIQNSEKALDLYKTSFIYYTKEKQRFEYGYLITNNSLLQLYLNKKDYENALVHSKIKTQYYERDLNNKEYFTHYLEAVYEQGQIYGFQLKYTDAIPLLEDLLKRTEKMLGKKNEYLNVLDYLTNCYASNSSYEKALQSCDEKINLVKSLYPEEKNLLGIYLADKGNVFLRMGDYVKAKQLFEEALPHISQDRIYDYANILSNVALCHIELANYKEAEKMYVKCLEVHQTTDTLNEHYSTALTNMAKLYYDMREYEKSADFYSRSLKIVERTVGKTSQLYVVQLNGLAATLLAMGEIEKSMNLYLESLEIMPRVFNKSDAYFSDLMNNIGHSLCVVQNYTDGITVLENVYQQYQSQLGGTNLRTLLGCANLSSAYHAGGFDEKAKPKILELFTNVNSVVNYNLKYLSEAESIEFLKRMEMYYTSGYSFLRDNPKTDASLRELILNTTLQNKGKLLLSNTALKNQITKSKDTELIATFNQWQEKIKLLSNLQSQANADVAAIEKTKKEAEILEKKLTNSSKEFEKALNKTYNWKDIQKNLTEDEIVIEFINFHYNSKFIYDSVVYGAFVFDKNSTTPTYVDVCQEIALEGILQKAGGNNLEYIESVYGKNKEKSPLYDIIWKPLLPYIKDGKRLIISPSGLLHKVSFAGISDGASNLNQRYKITNTNASATLVDRDEKKLATIKPLIVGGINYNLAKEGDYNEIWKFLSGTKEEAEQINSTFSESGITPLRLSYLAADELTFIESLKSVNLAHVATHGFFYPDPSLVTDEMALQTETVEDVAFRGGNRGAGHSFYVTNKNSMMRSGIALSGANQVWNQTDVNLSKDGVLTAQDISLLDLQNIELMVLSACETGLGDIKGTEGVYGLQRSLKIAGVYHIIMSLWQVPDKETKEFMTLFYQKLVLSKDIQMAFQETQLEMCTKYNAYYWAAFVLI